MDIRNLVKVFGFKIEYGLVYLIMERCDCSLSTTSPEGSQLLLQVLGDERLQRSLSQQVCYSVAQPAILSHIFSAPYWRRHCCAVPGSKQFCVQHADRCALPITGTFMYFSLFLFSSL